MTLIEMILEQNLVHLENFITQLSSNRIYDQIGIDAFTAIAEYLKKT